MYVYLYNRIKRPLWGFNKAHFYLGYNHRGHRVWKRRHFIIKRVRVKPKIKERFINYFYSLIFDKIKLKKFLWGFKRNKKLWKILHKRLCFNFIYRKKLFFLRKDALFTREKKKFWKKSMKDFGRNIKIDKIRKKGILRVRKDRKRRIIRIGKDGKRRIIRIGKDGKRRIIRIEKDGKRIIIRIGKDGKKSILQIGKDGKRRIIRIGKDGKRRVIRIGKGGKRGFIRIGKDGRKRVVKIGKCGIIKIVKLSKDGRRRFILKRVRRLKKVNRFLNFRKKNGVKKIGIKMKKMLIDKRKDFARKKKFYSFFIKMLKKEDIFFFRKVERLGGLVFVV